MKHSLLCMLFVALPLLGGCMETFKGGLQNRLVRTADNTGCMVASRWGLFSIGTDIAKADCDVLVDSLRVRELLRAMEAAAAQQEQAKKGPGL